MELNSYYQDRGMMKYFGFMLSEHNASMDKETAERYLVIHGKDEMDPEQIYDVLDYSIMKHEPVAIQLNIRDIEGNFLPDYEGFVRGYDDLRINVDGTFIPIGEIRHVELKQVERWFK